MAEKVLVTGATGFIGNHVVQTLVDRGQQVVVTSRDSEKVQSFRWYDRVVYKAVDISACYDEIDYYRYFDQPQPASQLLPSTDWQQCAG